MAIFKCKICGGTLNIDGTQSVAVCEYCGTKQTLPKLDDERKANLYDRANHFRRNNDFDKAMSIYEQILNEDPCDAESYWSILLCRYGIEYVEDSATHKRVPTINRAQYTSIFDDEDYKSALQYADGYQREIYEAEASAINEIQKGILEISQKEEPFDVFICYKETDANGRRTQDSVLATELYHELTREGFKVFFSRITLEDKLGQEYEPYIFAALNSAKVMVVLGTKPEHFNAVWVKNEWSRYLALIKNGAKKTLIPAYRDMDPYDLPEEFSHLQAQDMSKLGFMQDLTRGIKKIVEAGAPKATARETVVASSVEVNTAPLLKRASMFLEDGDWDKADEYYEKVLDIDPENARAYLGKLLVEFRAKSFKDLINNRVTSDNIIELKDNNNYKKAVMFGDQNITDELNELLYQRASDELKDAESEYECNRAAELFDLIIGYKDAAAMKEACFERIDDITYTRGINALDDAKSEDDCNRAAELFDLIIDYKDAAAMKEACFQKAKSITYDRAIRKMKEAETPEDLKAAANLFDSVIDYGNSAEKKESCYEEIYSIATETMNNASQMEDTSYKKERGYIRASNIYLLISASRYKDSEELYKKCDELAGISKEIREQITRKQSFWQRIIAASVVASIIFVIVMVVNFAPFGQVTENGLIYEKHNGSYVVTGYTDEVGKEIIIPEKVRGLKVTGIVSRAFYNFKYLTSIKIPNGVTSISDNAFYGCTGLTSITIPDSVTSIGNSAFAGCTYLTSIMMPDSVTSIGDSAFANCMGLKGIKISSNLTSIGDYIFSGCTGLISVDIPNSVMSIGNNAFYGCTKLARIEIPDSVTSIGNSAFAGCTNLTSITIPDSVTSIGINAFSGCNSLESITLPFVGDSVKTSIDTYQYPLGYIFGGASYEGGVATKQYYYGSSTSSTTSSTYYIPSTLKSVTITGGNIFYGAFYGCSSLTRITLPDGIINIGANAFNGCSKLTDIIIPDGVKSIGDYAFENCSSLESVTIGDSVKSIGNSAFRDCNNLTSITIPDSVTSINYCAFYGCSSLTSITIPDSVTSIGNYAFYYCSNLTSVTIPNSVTSIGSSAFSDCSSLTSVTIGDSVTSIERDAFNGCISLTSITIPDSVTRIGVDAFSGCTGLIRINFKGTKAQWYAMSRGSGWNSSTGSYKIYCTDGTISK